MLTKEKLVKRFVFESGWTKEAAREFADWYLTVNALVNKGIGMSIDYIGDWGYADAFESGRSPSSAAKEIIHLFKVGEL